MSELKDLEKQLDLGQLPSELSEKLVDAINKTGSDSEAKGAFDALIGVGKVTLDLLKDLALSDYFFNCPNDPSRGKVLEAARGSASTPGPGRSMNLIQACLIGLNKRASVLSALRLNGKLKEPDIRQFCSRWEEIRKRAKNASVVADEFGSILKQPISADPYSLNDFLGAFVNCRNASEHEGDFKTGPQRETRLRLKLNDDFFETARTTLEPAMGAYLRLVGPVLAQYLPCRIMRLRADASGNRAIVRPPRSERVDVSIEIPGKVRQTEKEIWFVDLVEKQFCFPLTTPDMVRDLDFHLPVEPIHQESRSPNPVPDTAPTTNNLQTAVATGLFTPVLGPGCYRVDANLSRGRAHVEDRKKRLRQFFDGEATEQHYVDSIVTSRLGISGLPVLPKLATAVAPPEPFEEQELLLLQVAVVRLGVKLTQCFAKAMGECIEAITEISRVSVKVEAREFAKIDELLDASVRSALALSEANGVVGQDPKLGLGAYGIEKRLKVLKETTTQQWPMVPITLLEWIGDLLWHTLRFSAPMYPAPDDLAFQISVCLEDSLQLRKHPVGAVASPFDADKRPIETHLVQWFGVWANRQGNVKSPFHEALARALYHALAPAPAASSGNSTAERTAARRQFVPVALDTTFEEELQRVFRKCGVPFHVAFPADLSYRHKETDGSNPGTVTSRKCWVLYSETAVGHSSWAYLGNEKNPDDWGIGQQSLSGRRFEGPLIVKLNGAPLVPLPPDDGVSVPLEGVPSHLAVICLRHRVIMSYSEVIRVVGNQDAVPPGLDLLLKIPRPIHGVPSARTLCLLGFSLTDSNNRLRVYDLHRGITSNNGGDPNASFGMLFVDTPRDPVEHAFLQVGKTLIDAELDEVARMIAHTTGLVDLPAKSRGGDAR
jgi:hypothetical protein